MRKTDAKDIWKSHKKKYHYIYINTFPHKQCSFLHGVLLFLTSHRQSNKNPNAKHGKPPFKLFIGDFQTKLLKLYKLLKLPLLAF